MIDRTTTTSGPKLTADERERLRRLVDERRREQVAVVDAASEVRIRCALKNGARPTYEKLIARLLEHGYSEAVALAAIRLAKAKADSRGRMSLPTPPAPPKRGKARAK